MSHYVVTAKLDTVVAVRYTNANHIHGKWKTQPGGSVSVGTNQIFQAENHDVSAPPPEGWASYIAADGTTFKFHFDDPQSESNSCKSSMNPVTGPYTLPIPDYPKSGKTWTVTYYINGAAAFFDAPVFPDDIVDAGRCSLYPDEQIRKWIGGRDCVHLSDVYEEGLPHSVNVWCATNRVFLTPLSKGLLTQDLAQHAVKQLSQPNSLSTGLMDDALQANKDFLDGAIGLARLAEIRKSLDEKAQSARCGSSRDAEIIGVVRSLLDENAEEGWVHAVSSYLGKMDDEPDPRVMMEISNLIKARL